MIAAGVLALILHATGSIMAEDEGAIPVDEPEERGYRPQNSYSNGQNSGGYSGGGGGGILSTYNWLGSDLGLFVNELAATLTAVVSRTYWDLFVGAVADSAVQTVRTDYALPSSLRLARIYLGTSIPSKRNKRKSIRAASFSTYYAQALNAVAD
ncbi:hypothetical protein BV898_18304 [Hypsibius exemplaris]|uniref:Uncharacterized protein n=1 Tax=Hypsibius exemplaris TaxID=2072580 RepID=A0A9X6RNC5_HYPEX|nr:hypothetical protein BV898_18304 [Hypsibius exemplaris]